MRSETFVADADNAERTVVFSGGEDMKLNVHIFTDLGRRIGEEIQGTCEWVVDGYVIGVIADENDVPIVAVPDYPFGGGSFIVDGEASEEEIGTADGRGEVRVRAQAEWAESRGVGFEDAEEYA